MQVKLQHILHDHIIFEDFFWRLFFPSINLTCALSMIDLEFRLRELPQARLLSLRAFCATFLGSRLSISLVVRAARSFLLLQFCNGLTMLFPSNQGTSTWLLVAERRRLFLLLSHQVLHCNSPFLHVAVRVLDKTILVYKCLLVVDEVLADAHLHIPELLRYGLLIDHFLPRLLILVRLFIQLRRTSLLF